MKYHAGFLSDDRENDRSWRWMNRGWWSDPQFPPDIRLEIAAFIHLPGFQDQFFIQNLSMGKHHFYKQRDLLPTYDEIYDVVVENWMSVTRDDCIKLARLRPGQGSSVPLIAQMQMVKELSTGTRSIDVQRTYGVSEHMLRRIKRDGVQVSRLARPLPPGFELLASVS